MIHQTKTFRALLCACVLAAVSFTACKKTSGSSNANANMALFYFHLYPYVDSTPVSISNPDALYKDSLGRYFGLSTAQFFIYNVVLTNTSGSTYTINDVYLLTDLDSGRYMAGYAPPGTYSGVSFNVGIDAGTNALQPTVFTPGGYVQSSTMYYAGGQGYMSLLLNGFADTATHLTDTGLVYFSYEIGSQAYPETVAMPARTGSPYAPYTAVASGTDTISLICDYGKVLSAVSFKTQDTTDSYTINTSVAAAIAGNIPHMFRYEQ